MEYFLRPLLRRNKNAQLEQERGSAVLLTKLLGESQYPALAEPLAALLPRP